MSRHTGWNLRLEPPGAQLEGVEGETAGVWPGGGDSRRVACGGTQWSREQVAGALGEEGLEGLSCWSILLGRACGVGTRVWRAWNQKDLDLMCLLCFPRRKT